MGDFSVLVVDDEEDFVNTLLKRLRRKGVDCEGAYCGADALGWLDRRDFDVVLLDMKLKNEDGSDVLREIKGLRPAARVVVLSGHACANTGRGCLEGGASDYLIKPVEFESLYERLHKAGNAG